MKDTHISLILTFLLSPITSRYASAYALHYGIDAF